MAKLCKPNIKAICTRMAVAERLNNMRGVTYYGGGKSHGVFSMEVFGIKKPTRTGAFDLDELIQELKAQNKKHE